LNEAVLDKLNSLVDMEHSCGYVTLIRLKKTRAQLAADDASKESSSDPKNGRIHPDNATLVKHEKSL
jgi:hypothetical protein